MIKIGTIIGDRYEILERIGTGGMSDVYKAKCHKLNRYVAVKVLKQEFSENTNFVSKFRVEAQAAASLMHSNIVNVYDVGEENGIYYIVMELVEGITLKKYIEKKARLSVKEAVSIAIQACMGIEAAHKNHIIHRDIKPQNIIISKDGKVKVTDFGIAKAATSDTITSNVMGSVHYTSPEQARGGYSDEKSDIYSMGITLFEMLTGRVPFNGETTVAIAIKHIQEEMPSPRDYIAEIPVSVEQIVLKCTQKSPDRRYHSMAELIEDLKRSLMSPDEDFVKIEDPDETGATRLMPESPQARVRKSSTASASASAPAAKAREEKRSDTGEVRLKKNQPKKKKPVVYEEPEDEYDEDDEDSKMEKITTVLAVVGAILIGIIVIFLAGRALGVFGTAEQETTEIPVVTEESAVVEESISETEEVTGIPVPNVIGKMEAEAVATLQNSGFTVNRMEAISDTVEKGYVVSQDPAGDSRAEAGSAVTIVISKGIDTENKIQVPDVFGMDVESAIVMLTEAGLVVRNQEEMHYEDPALLGKVCYMSYSALSYVEPGTEIDIGISIGPEQATYKYEANIESPALEDPSYVAGTSCVLYITTASGKEVHRTETGAFPYAVNVQGLTDAQGIITFEYDVQQPATTTTDENGETVTIPGAIERKMTQRVIQFTPEG